MVKVETLVLVHKNNKVLLGMKKRGFGEGRHNGFGGKLKEGETLIECVIRETQEEAGITVLDLIYSGKILFKFLDSDEQDHEVHIYRATDYEGEPVETEEMSPKWFGEDELPYDEMWIDDKYWIPLLLAKKKFVGEFHFSGKEIAHHELNEVEVIE